MILHRRAVLGALALATASSAARAAPDALRGLIEGADSVLGVAVIARDRNGQVVLAEAQGTAVLGEGATRRERPFTLDTPVRVASISKMVAAAALMTLVQDGRLGLDADVSDALGARLRHPAYPDRPITAAMLASHTSGLRNGASYPVPTGRRLLDVLTPGPRIETDWWSPPEQPPGVFAYGDVNYPVLAQLIERITGERFDRFMTRTVLAPLGLDAGYNWSGASQAARDRASACCRLEDGVWTPKVDALVPLAPLIQTVVAPERPGFQVEDYRLGENGFAFAPQGGLRACVRDLDALARAFQSGRIGGLSPESIARMTTPLWRFDGADGDTARGFYRAYGLGVQVPTASPEGDAFFGWGSSDWRGHFGEAYGLVSGCWWNRRDGRTLAYVINGTPREAGAARADRSAATPWEQALIDAALAR